MKKFLVLFLSFALVFSLSTSIVSASTGSDEEKIDPPNGNEISILTDVKNLNSRGVIECDKSPDGSHYCTMPGTATVFSGTRQKPGKMRFTGEAFQCKYCYTTVVTSGKRVPFGGSLEYYVVLGGYERLSTHTYAYIGNANLSYTTKSSLPGFKFFY